MTNALKKKFSVKLLGWNRAKLNLPTYQKQNNVEIYRPRIPASYANAKVLLSLPIWWVYIFFFFLKNYSKINIIHACDLDGLIPALVIKLFKKDIKIVYDIFDFYADRLIVLKFMKNIVRAVEINLIKNNLVNKIIIVDKSRRLQIAESFTNKKSIVITNSPQLDKPIPEIIPKKYNSIFDNKSFIISWVGKLSKGKGIEDIISSIKDNPKVKLIIAGYEGTDIDFFKLLSRNQKNVFFIGAVNQQESLIITCKSDLLFAMYNPEIPNNVFASPNKLFEAMALGKPILVNSNTTMAYIVTKYSCGFVVNYQDNNGIIKVINEMETNRKLFTLMGENGKKAYNAFFKWPIMEKRLLEIYNNLFDE